MLRPHSIPRKCTIFIGILLLGFCYRALGDNIEIDLGGGSKTSEKTTSFSIPQGPICKTDWNIKKT